MEDNSDGAWVSLPIDETNFAQVKMGVIFPIEKLPTEVLTCTCCEDGSPCEGVGL